MKKIVVQGSIGVDHIFLVPVLPNKGQTIITKDFQFACGGKGANQAVALAKLGAQVQIIGHIGNDETGQIALKNLENNNVDIKYVSKLLKASTQVATIIVDEKGDNLIIIDSGANFIYKKNEIEEYKKLIDECDILLLQLETSFDFVKELVDYASKLNKLIVLNPAPARELSHNLIKKCDFLIPNETELCLILGKKYTTDMYLLETYARELQNISGKNIIVTLGDKGALWINQSKTLRKYSPYKVKAIDATACGDTFVGALVFYLAQDKSINDAIKFAIGASALTATKLGAQPSLPNLTEVATFINSHTTLADLNE